MKEILIVKPSSLGDVVHTLPSAAILRQRFPEARIQWLVNTEWMPLLEGNADLDGIVEFPRRRFRGLEGMLRIPRWGAEVREQVRPDLILDYQGLLRSALLSRLCRRGGTRVLGLSDAREGARYFYHSVADVSGCVHAVDRYLALTRLVCGQISVDHLAWPLPTGAAPSGFAAESYVVLHPFSRGVGKSLSVEQVVALCERLAPHPVVLVGRTDVQVPAMSNVIDLLNQTTLPELIWLLRAARFVVSVDSGPMHIASALTERLVSIHTWSEPEKVGPYRREAWVWKNGWLFQRGSSDSPGAQREVAKIEQLAEFVRTQI